MPYNSDSTIGTVILNAHPIDKQNHGVVIIHFSYKLIPWRKHKDAFAFLLRDFLNFIDKCTCYAVCSLKPLILFKVVEVELRQIGAINRYVIIQIVSQFRVYYL